MLITTEARRYYLVSEPKYIATKILLESSINNRNEKKIDTYE